MKAFASAGVIYLDLCLRLRQAAIDKDQVAADKIWALTEMLEWAYPGIRNDVREAHGLPPTPSQTGRNEG